MAPWSGASAIALPWSTSIDAEILSQSKIVNHLYVKMLEIYKSYMFVTAKTAYDLATAVAGDVGSLKSA